VTTGPVAVLVKSCVTNPDKYRAAAAATAAATNKLAVYKICINTTQQGQKLGGKDSNSLHY